MAIRTKEGCRPHVLDIEAAGADLSLTSHGMNRDSGQRGFGNHYRMVENFNNGDLKTAWYGYWLSVSFVQSIRQSRTIMHTIRNCNHIRTSRTIKSFRTCAHATGSPMSLLDKGRRQMGELKRLWNCLHQAWLNKP